LTAMARVTVSGTNDGIVVLCFMLHLVLVAKIILSGLDEKIKN